MGRHGQGSWDTVKRGKRTYRRFRITIDGRTVERVSLSKSKLDKAADELRKRARARLIGDDENITLETWALDRWLVDKTTELGDEGAKTIRNYKAILTKHVIPALGTVKIRDIRAQHRRNFQRTLLAKGLKRTTVNVVDGVLKACLQAAANEELPVAASVLTVKQVKPAVEAERRLTPASVAKIIAGASGSFWWALWVCFAYTGARDSEVRALRWDDWTPSPCPSCSEPREWERYGLVAVCRDCDRREEDAGVLRIRRQLPQQPGDPPRWLEWIKGRKIERVVPVVPPLAQVLREHRTKQNETRLGMGGMWNDYGLIFPDEIGRALGHQRVNYQFAAACTDAKVPTWKGLGVHQLRHAANNLLRELGVDAPLRAQILGHTKEVNEGTYTAENLALAAQALGKMARAMAD